MNLLEDCTFDVAVNGLDAINLVKKNAGEGTFYDIIFMDCNMPIMDGFEASKLIDDHLNLPLDKSIEIFGNPNKRAFIYALTSDFSEDL